MVKIHGIIMLNRINSAPRMFITVPRFTQFNRYRIGTYPHKAQPSTNINQRQVQPSSQCHNNIYFWAETHIQTNNYKQNLIMCVDLNKHN